MPRKTKPDELKAITRTISISRSLSDYARANHINISKATQVHVASEVLNMSLDKFKSMYALVEDWDRRSHSDDSMVTEYIRAARWMLEGQIIATKAVCQLNEYAPPTLRVKWSNGDETTVGIDYVTTGFRHVVYDNILESDWADIRLTGLETEQYDVLAACPLKTKLIKRWIEISEERDNA